MLFVCKLKCKNPSRYLPRFFYDQVSIIFAHNLVQVYYILNTDNIKINFKICYIFCK